MGLEVQDVTKSNCNNCIHNDVCRYKQIRSGILNAVHKDSNIRSFTNGDAPLHLEVVCEKYQAKNNIAVRGIMHESEEE